MNLNGLHTISPYVLLALSVFAATHGVNRVVKRGWSRKYMALAVLSSLLAGLAGLIIWNKMRGNPYPLVLLEKGLVYLLLYLMLSFGLFVLYVFMLQWRPVSLNQDYLLILGTGVLPDGTVSLVLQYRLDKALTFYNKQKSQHKKPAKLIVSGGRGPTAPCSEAEVMRDYLMAKGIPSDDILLEKDSINTHQNFLFSSRMIDRYQIGKNGLFVTNDFHVPRSKLYARQAGIAADGIGAPTPWMQFPYSVGREYIALLLIYRYYHAVVAGILFGVFLYVF